MRVDEESASTQHEERRVEERAQARRGRRWWSGSEEASGGGRVRYRPVKCWPSSCAKLSPEHRVEKKGEAEERESALDFGER